MSHDNTATVPSCLQAFKCDQGSWQGLEALMKELPGVPDAVISNAALGSATVEQYEPDPHKQDLAMLQVLPLHCAFIHSVVAADAQSLVRDRRRSVASML